MTDIRLNNASKIGGRSNLKKHAGNGAKRVGVWRQCRFAKRIKISRTYVSGTDIHPHMQILRRRISTLMFTCGWAWPARSPNRPIASGGAKFTKLAIPCLRRR